MNNEFDPAVFIDELVEGDYDGRLDIVLAKLSEEQLGLIADLLEQLNKCRSAD